MKKSKLFSKSLLQNYMPSLKFALITGLVLSCSMPVWAQAGNPKSKGRLVKKDAVSAYIVRDEMSKSLKLTMLIAHKSSFSKRVVKMVGHSLVPLTFSVSTAPNTTINFVPEKIEFIQNGKTWHADSLQLADVVIRLNENETFGGVIKSGDTQQAVFLLPGWFDINAPLFVRYDDQETRMPLVSAGGE